MDVDLSDIDEQRFGIRTARASGVLKNDLPSLLDYCRENEVIFLIARCGVRPLETAQELMQSGFLLTGTLVYYRKDLRNEANRNLALKGLSIRPMQSTDSKRIEGIAAIAFKDFVGHYHSDPRLDRKKCDETYVDWAMKLCRQGGLGHEVFLAEAENTPVGFVILRVLDDKRAEIILNAMDPHFQNRGFYKAALLELVRHYRNRGFADLLISTQLANTAAQKACTALGFEYHRASYTFHKWFPSPELRGVDLTGIPLTPAEIPEDRRLPSDGSRGNPP